MKDIELPPLPDADVYTSTALIGYRYSYSAILMQSYARAAVEADRAQRVPEGWLNVLEDFEKKERSPFQAYLAAGLANELRAALLASTPAQPAQQEPDWKDMYEKEKRRSAMWVAKYEKDIGPLEYAVPVAHQEPPQPVERKPMTDEINQCDGCRRGLPLKGGMHTGPGVWDKMVCQKHRYEIKE